MHDGRPREEFDAAHLLFARSVPLPELAQRSAEQPLDAGRPEHVDVELRPILDAVRRVAALVERLVTVRNASARPSAEDLVGRSSNFRDFAKFEQRMMRPTFADHHLDEAKIAVVRRAEG